MSAELVDPFTPQPLLTADEFDAIKADILDAPWNDPARFPECLQVALETLGSIGCGTGEPPAQQATQALRRMVQRAASGVPFNEPQQPAWSLDPTPRHIPGGEG